MIAPIRLTVCSPTLQVVFEGMLLGGIHLLLLSPVAFLVVRRIRAGTADGERLRSAAGLLFLATVVAVVVVGVILASVSQPGPWVEDVVLLVPLAIQCTTTLFLVSTFPAGQVKRLHAPPRR